MKRVLVLAALAVSLSACDRIPTKVGSEVRGVEVGVTKVDDWAEELHVELKETESGQVWDVNLGAECAQYPLPQGQRFLARFDRMASKAEPNNITVQPDQTMVWNYLCG